MIEGTGDKVKWKVDARGARPFPRDFARALC